MKLKRSFKSGQKWITPEGIIYKVDFIAIGGFAHLLMYKPIRITNKTFKQLTVPDDWRRYYGKLR